MEKLYEYVEEHKEQFRDNDYKVILECIMREKAVKEKLRLNDKTSLSKLFILTNDYIRLTKAYLNLNMEREGCCIPNTIPSIDLDMEYMEFQRMYQTGEINPLM